MRPPAPAAEDRWRGTDLRLWPVAAAVWAIGLASGSMRPAVLLGLAAGAAVLSPFVARRGRAGSSAAVAVLAAVAVAAGTAAVRGEARGASPLRDLAATGATVEVTLTVGSRPHRLAGPEAPRVVNRAGNAAELPA